MAKMAVSFNLPYNSLVIMEAKDVAALADILGRSALVVTHWVEGTTHHVLEPEGASIRAEMFSPTTKIISKEQYESLLEEAKKKKNMTTSVVVGED